MRFRSRPRLKTSSKLSAFRPRWESSLTVLIRWRISKGRSTRTVHRGVRKALPDGGRAALRLPMLFSSGSQPAYLPLLDALKYTSATAIHSKSTTFQVKMLKVACKYTEHRGSFMSYSTSLRLVLSQSSVTLTRRCFRFNCFFTVPSSGTSLGRDSDAVTPFNQRITVMRTMSRRKT